MVTTILGSRKAQVRPNPKQAEGVRPIQGPAAKKPAVPNPVLIPTTVQVDVVQDPIGPAEAQCVLPIPLGLFAAWHSPWLRESARLPSWPQLLLPLFFREHPDRTCSHD